MLPTSGSAQSIHHAPPARGLESFVRCFGQRWGFVGGAGVVQPIHARAAPILEFNFGVRTRVAYTGGREKFSSRGVLIGMQTHRRGELHVAGSTDTFAILFQPTGLYRLFSFPVHELTDNDFELRAVLDRSIDELEERLWECSSFVQRTAVANQYLLQLASTAAGIDGVAAAANLMVQMPGTGSITALASMAGMRCASSRDDLSARWE